MIDLKGEFTFPDLILLDINMPTINGWDFLAEFEEKGLHKKFNSLIYILTTSNNPDDILKASNLDFLNGFLIKLLSVENRQVILQKYFSK